MRAAQLGASGPNLSVIGHGTWEVGGRADRPAEPETQAVASVLTAIDSGMNWIDTAETYGAGRAERFVTCLSPAPGRTCCFEAGAYSVEFRVWVRTVAGTLGIERTLRRLGGDRVDMYMLHWADPFVSLVDTWSAMCELVDAELVRWIGVSNFSQDLVETCHALRPVDFIEVELSMLNRDSKQLISWCSVNGVGVPTYGYSGTACSPALAALPRTTRQRFSIQASSTRLCFQLGLPVDALAQIGQALGCTPGQLALAWAAHQDGVTSVLSGSRKPSHIEENALAGDLRLPEAVLLSIDETLEASAAAPSRSEHPATDAVEARQRG